MDYMPVGQEIGTRDPTGETAFQGNEKFILERKEKMFPKIWLIHSSSGLTENDSSVTNPVC